MVKLSIEIRNGISTTRESGRVIVGPFQFAATRFVPEDSSPPGPGDGTYVYEGEWTVPPRAENQAS